MAGSDYYDHRTFPSHGAAGSSSGMRSELGDIEAGFGKLPDLVVANANLPVFINASGTAQEAISADSARSKLGTGTNLWCGMAGGSANALALTPAPAVVAYVSGQRFLFKSGAAANTTAVIAAVSGLPAIAVQVNGAACTGGEILANSWYEVVVDASLTSCQLNKIGRATLAELGAAALAGATFTGPVSGPTPAAGDNDTSLATTEFVQGMDTNTNSIDANAWNKNGTVVSYASGATNTPTNAGILTHHCNLGGLGDGYQLWQNFNGNGNLNMWSRQWWSGGVGGAWTAWEAISPFSVAQLDARYANLAGLSTQQFSVANATTSTKAVALGQFVNTLGAALSAAMPAGLVIKAGISAGVGSGGTGTVVFPVAFPASCVSVVFSENTNSATAASHSVVSAVSASQFSWLNASAGTTAIYWIAIGF